MIQLQPNSRQLKILEFIRSQGDANNQEIVRFLKNPSRVTVVRDLSFLMEKGLLRQKGKGRNIRYEEKIHSAILRYIDASSYFKKGPDERKILFENFNFGIFKILKNVFTAEEKADLKKHNLLYQKRIKTFSKTLIQKEFERLTIELSWKSSQIEGNTYSLLDTEVLIKEHQEAPGHKKEEAVMILNHKKALDFILASPKRFKKLSLRDVLNIHQLLVQDLSVVTGVRKRRVGVIGTRYQPLDNEHQIREALEKFIRLINQTKDPFSRALLAITMISYIQPFEDGNKRTARLLANALLLASNACPLSYRSVNEVEYKKALILFYEHNNIRFLKDIFIEQFVFASKNYFQ